MKNLLGRAKLDEDVRAQVIKAAEGNPLFVEEMLAMLIDDGLLERENGNWVATADLADDHGAAHDRGVTRCAP